LKQGLLVVFLFPLSVFAQKIDSASLKKSPILQDTINWAGSKVDTVADRLSRTWKAFEVKQPVFKNRAVNLGSQISLNKILIKTPHIFDTLNPPQKIHGAIGKAQNKIDSLNPYDLLIQHSQRLESLRKRLTQCVDSLDKFKLTDRGIAKSLDSLKLKLDSLKNSGPIKDIKNAEAKLAGLETGVNSKINGVLGQFGKNGVNLPGINLSKVNLYSNLGLGSQIPKLNLPSNPLGGLKTPNLNNLTGENLNGLGTNQIQTPGLNAGQSNVLGKEMNSLTNLPKENLDIKGVGEMKNVEKEMGEVGKVSKEINGYQKDIKNIRTGDMDNVQQLPKELETKAANLSQVKGLSAQTTQVANYKEMAAKWESDPEYRKELAVNKAKEQVINHFAGHEQALMAAMSQLSKLKAKTKDAEQMVDMFKKQPNPMKGKPFIERLLPGINLQIQKKNDLLIDFNPYVGYRISGRFTSGLGWNERLGVNTKQKTSVPMDHIYGVRSFVHFKIKVGVFAKAEVESMNTDVPQSVLLGPSEHPGRQWVRSYFAGLKKDFRYSNSMMGNMQVLYNLYNPHHMSPYVSKLNVRIGIEFPIRKKAGKEQSGNTSALKSANLIGARIKSGINLPVIANRADSSTCKICHARTSLSANLTNMVLLKIKDQKEFQGKAGMMCSTHAEEFNQRIMKEKGLSEKDLKRAKRKAKKLI
jgi:hypothetical protein